MISKPVVNEAFDHSHYDLVCSYMASGYQVTKGLIVCYTHPDNLDDILVRKKANDLTSWTNLWGRLNPIDGVFRSLWLHENRPVTNTVSIVIVQTVCLHKIRHLTQRIY